MSIGTCVCRDCAGAYLLVLIVRLHLCVGECFCVCVTGFTMEEQGWVGMEQPTCLYIICVCGFIILVNIVMV